MIIGKYGVFKSLPVSLGKSVTPAIDHFLSSSTYLKGVLISFVNLKALYE